MSLKLMRNGWDWIMLKPFRQRLHWGILHIDSVWPEGIILKRKDYISWDRGKKKTLTVCLNTQKWVPIALPKGQFCQFLIGPGKALLVHCVEKPPQASLIYCPHWTRRSVCAYIDCDGVLAQGVESLSRLRSVRTRRRKPIICTSCSRSPCAGRVHTHGTWRVRDAPPIRRGPPQYTAVAPLGLHRCVWWKVRRPRCENAVGGHPCRGRN